MGKRELIALLNLSSWCLVMVERLFLTMPRGCLQFVIVVFPDHTHLLFCLKFVVQITINHLLKHFAPVACVTLKLTFRFRYLVHFGLLSIVGTLFFITLLLIFLIIFRNNGQNCFK